MIIAALLRNSIALSRWPATQQAAIEEAIFRWAAATQDEMRVEEHMEQWRGYAAGQVGQGMGQGINPRRLL